MPVKLRLKRQGRKKAPHYAIVVADSRAPRDGRYIEKVGFYNPITNPAQIYIDHDTAIKWLRVGAQPTNTVRAILRHAGVTLKFALIKQGKEEDEMERIFSSWWEMKKGKKKKKFVQVDIHGKPLEEIPVIELAQHKSTGETPSEEVTPEATEEVTEVATATATEEVTPEATEESTEEVTAKAAEEVTPEATEETKATKAAKNTDVEASSNSEDTSEVETSTETEKTEEEEAEKA